MTEEAYLGDAVYASYDKQGDIKLRTRRGDTEHIIHMDADVLEAFLQYIEETAPGFINKVLS